MDTDNIKIGEGDLTLQYEGEAEPTNVGACRNCDMDYKISSILIKEGKYTAPIDKMDTEVLVTLEIELIEANMRNLVIAFGGTPNVDIDENTEPGTLIYKPSGMVKTSKFCELIYSVPQVKSKTKKDIYTIFRAKSMDGIKFSHRKDKELFFKAKFHAFADPNHDGAPYQIQYNAPI